MGVIEVSEVAVSLSLFAASDPRGLDPWRRMNNRALKRSCVHVFVVLSLSVSRFICLV